MSENEQKFIGQDGKTVNRSADGTSQETGLYDPRKAALWSLLFTPVFGAFILKNNWKILKQEQREKRQMIWMIALAAVLFASFLFIGSAVCIGISLVSLAAWFFLECRAQMDFLAGKHLEIPETDWKPVLIKAAVILVCAVAAASLLLLVSGSGGPALDCSGNRAYLESSEEIVEYLKEEYDVPEIVERMKYGDETEEDKEIMEKVRKVQLFLDWNRPNDLSKEERDELDGMSARKLVKYVDSRYELDHVVGKLRKKE